MVQEELLRQLLTDSKAYGSLLGSGGVGDPGRVSNTHILLFMSQAVMCCGTCINIDNLSAALFLKHLIADAEQDVLTGKQYDVLHCAMSLKIKLFRGVSFRHPRHNMSLLKLLALTCVPES